MYQDYDDSLSDDENALVMDLKEDENDDLWLHQWIKQFLFKSTSF